MEGIRAGEAQVEVVQSRGRVPRERPEELRAASGTDRRCEEKALTERGLAACCRGWELAASERGRWKRPGNHVPLTFRSAEPGDRK